MRHGVQRVALVDEAAAGRNARRAGARASARRARVATFSSTAARSSQQVAHRGQQARVVPGLGDVVGRAGLDQVHGGFEVRPCGRAGSPARRDAARAIPEQRDAFFARGGLAPEVHVLDDQVHFWERTVARASAGDEAPRTRAPCRDNRTWKAVRTASLSSATSTVRCARRSSTFDVIEVIRKTLGRARGLQATGHFCTWED